MRAFVTGVGGFAGQFLAAELLAAGIEVHGVLRGDVTWHVPGLEGHPGLHLLLGDLRDSEWVRRSLTSCVPDQVYLLAAQASVGAALVAPLETITSNTAVVLNVLEALRPRESSADVAVAESPRVLLVSSGEVYGRAVTTAPLREQMPLCPENAYAVSKVAQDLLGYQYFRAYRIPVVRVRPFNHTGPGQQAGFVVADFASQVAAVERGLRDPVIEVGNLAAQRDFTDVRDMVRAYRLAATAGELGAVYNVGSGQAVAIQEILDYLCSQSQVEIEVRVDPLRYRPVDAPLLVCDASALRQRTGWTPTMPLTRTLDDVLAYWRTAVGTAVAGGTRLP